MRFFFVSAFIAILMLLLSGCRAVKSVVSYLAGNESAETPEKPSEGGSGAGIDTSGPTFDGGENAINFDPLVLWAIMLIGIALAVRFLVKRYATHDTKE